MILNGIMAALAVLSFAITLWQWVVARRFPIHGRATDLSFAPAVTVLKPLKGCDEFTEACLRSWFMQEYAGRTEILFVVADANDPVCPIVEKLRGEFPQCDAQLVVCPERLGANGKVSKLVQVEARAKHDTIVVSDADVRVPVDFLANVVAPLRDEKAGLVSCFYRLANPGTVAMKVEAVAINADFWSQVLQSRSLKSLDFALGAAMVTRRKQLAEIGGFGSLVDCLADDYQLGHRIAKRGHRIELCPVVVECWLPRMGFLDVWRHQLRWARTIRVCQPWLYFASIVNNATLWPLMWMAVNGPKIIVMDVSPPSSKHIFLEWPMAFLIGAALICARTIIALVLANRLTNKDHGVNYFWLVPAKDILQFAIWFCAFTGNTVEWRGEKLRARSDGTIVRR